MNESSETCLPHAIGPEKSVLSSMFQDPQEYIGLAAELGITSSDFYHPAHATIYNLLVEKFNDNQPIELVELSQTLLDRNLMASIGGPAAITEIYTYASNHVSFRNHAHIVLNKSLLRKIINTAMDTLNQAYDPDTNPHELLEQIESSSLSLRNDNEMTDSSMSMGELLKKCLQHYEQCQKHGGFGIPTGFPDLDSQTGGFHPGDLNIIAARPSMGKTAFAMACMEHICAVENIPGLFFSVEMNDLSIGHRSISAFSNTNLGELVQGSAITPKIMHAVQHAVKGLKNSPLRIIDTPGMTAPAIRARTRREVKKHGIKIVFIDYLQLLVATNKAERENSNIRISNALKILKNMARELHICVVVLAQLRRDAEGKLCCNLNNSMIKDCGEAEQDADGIYMIGESETPDEDELTIKRSINITKQRQGPTGLIPSITFHKTCARFTP